MEKPHVALFSSPGLGHLIPVIELANRLVIQHNFKATVLAFTCETSEPKTQVLKSATNNTNLCDIIEIPGADISALIEQYDVVPCPVKLLSLIMQETKPAIRSALQNLTPRPSTIIFDLFSGDILQVADELKIRKFVYVPSHTWFLSLAMHSPILDKQVKGEYVDQKEPLRIPGCHSVQPEDVLDAMQNRETEQYKAYLDSVDKISKGEVFLVNTWEGLQQKELQALRNTILKVPVYGIGPVVRQTESETSPLNDSVVEWLDQQATESVIYVSFGSRGTLSYEQIVELALGLELSGYRFVWVMRLPSGTEMESSGKALFQGELDESRDKDDPLRLRLRYLLKGFLSRTQNVGRLVLWWAPQVAILSHPSIGGFLSHCGWGSALESITSGVPMIAWPLYAEQKMNATLLAEELGVAVRPKVLPTKKVVDREEIASMIRQIMEVDRDGKPNPIRKRVKELKHGALSAVSKRGSSYTALSEVAKIMQSQVEFPTSLAV